MMKRATEGFVDESRLKGGECRLQTHRLMEVVSQMEDPDVLQGETRGRSIRCDRRGARLAQIIGGCQSRVSWLPKARVATDERRLGQSDHVFLVAGAGWGGTEGQCCGWGPERGSS